MIYTTDSYSDFLHKSCEDVDPCSDDTKEIVKELLDHSNDIACLGIAANQIGYHKSIAIMKLSMDEEFRVVINPSILYTINGNLDINTDTVISVEGCLSLDGQYALRRNRTIKLIYFNLKGEIVNMELNDLDAVIVQHEYSHLNGILISDHGKKVLPVKEK